MSSKEEKKGTIEKTDYLKNLNVIKSSTVVRSVVVVAVAFSLIFGICFVVGMYYAFDKMDQYENGLIVMDESGNIGKGHLSRVDETEVAKLQFEATLVLGVGSLYSYTDETFKSNMDKALPLFDESGKFVYDSYRRDNIHHYIAANNIEVEAFVDSVDVVNGLVKFRQIWKRDKEEKIFYFSGKFSMNRVPVTKVNRYGAKIYDWSKSDLTKEEYER